MLLIVLYLPIVMSEYLATVKCARLLSKYYLDNNRSIPSTFYYPSTSPTLFVQDRCLPITNSQLRKQYSWVTKSDDVDHMVDNKNGPTYLSMCSKDIRGNKIVAIAAWNRAVGNMCWKDVEKEKRLVYGDTAVDYALDSVRICCEQQETISSTVVLVVGLCSCISFVVLIVVVVIKARWGKKVKEDNILTIN